MEELYDDLELEEVDELEESEETIESLIEDELGEDVYEDDYALIRDLLDQNVEEQHLPSENKFDVLEGEGRNAIYRLKDDATIQLFDYNTKEIETITGEEFNQRLMDEYGMDSVVYSNGEADFSNYVSSIHKSDILELLEDEEDKEFIGHGILEKSADSLERYGEYGTITEAHALIAKELDCDVEDVKAYLKDNQLVIHEEGINGFDVVPYHIHNLFDHTGSIGIKKDLNALCESIIDTCDNDSFTLVKDDTSKEVEDLEQAISQAIEKNKSIKRDRL